MTPHNESSPTVMRTDPPLTQGISERRALEQLGKDTGSPVSEVESLYLANAGLLYGATEGEYAGCLEGLREFRTALREDRAARGAKRRAGRKAQGAGDAVLLAPMGSAAELERARVLSKHLARVAADDPEVWLFRYGFFGNPRGVVESSVARSIVESPSLHCLLPAFFRERGIPALNHRARLLGVEFGVDKELSLLTETVTLDMEWNGERIQHTERILLSDRIAYERAYLKYPNRAVGQRPLPVRRGGCLWPLHRAAEKLAGRFWWSEAEATWFLLTGAVPELHPVQVSISGAMDQSDTPLLTKLSIRALPFASGASVKKAYLGAVKLVTSGKRGPAIHISNLRLFDFVEEWRGPERRKPRWAELLKRWNSIARPDWRYSHRAHLRRDYLRTRDLVTTALLPESPAPAQADSSHKLLSPPNEPKPKRRTRGQKVGKGKVVKGQRRPQWAR